MTPENKILVVRTDRLGDVMMALPSLKFLRMALPTSQIEFLCRPEFAEVVRPYLLSENISVLTLRDNEKISLSRKKYSGLLLLYSDFRLGLAAFLARVKLRVGIFSKPWSFILLNHGIRQARSKAEKNEALYNLDLAKALAGRLGGNESSFPSPILLSGDKNSEEAAKSVLWEIELTGETPFLILHPGMGGSAGNLTAEQYLNLIDTLERTRKETVVISIGPSSFDREIGRLIFEKKPEIKKIRHQSLPVLREIFRLSKLVIAPSTGPLHLAHFVGATTIGLYPAEWNERKERWAPFGGTGKSIVLSPEDSGKSEMQDVDWAGLLLRTERVS